MNAPAILITIGDPAGIGPEVAIRAMVDVPQPHPVALVGPMTCWREALQREGMPEQIHLQTGAPSPFDGNSISVMATADPERDITPGDPSAASGSVALDALDLAATEVASGRASAIVTAPLAKHWVAKNGLPFTGHTGYLAARANVKDPVMYFHSEKLKVALMTAHIPLRKVPSSLTRERLRSVVTRLDDVLRERCHLDKPHIAVSGINPHAGEGGILGTDEEDWLIPAISNLSAEGFHLSGPHPGDTVFRRALQGDFDAVIAMYHDQGLAALKTLAYEDTVNVTLGLPYIRTSPDHGTAFDTAGTGRARVESMTAALRLATTWTAVPESLF